MDDDLDAVLAQIRARAYEAHKLLEDYRDILFDADLNMSQYALAAVFALLAELQWLDAAKDTTP